jgi:outer membrane receptor protein involved in Fe transport
VLFASLCLMLPAGADEAASPGSDLPAVVEGHEPDPAAATIDPEDVAEADASAQQAADEAAEEATEGFKPEISAPEVPAPDSEIEEIVVTGSRTESLMEVPISATTFSASDIQELRIQNIADLSDYTPNLEINTAFAASNPTIFIRGIGLKDYNANSSGAVAVYQDGISINSPVGQLFQMFDVQSVEVLRGPQGSLNGRNATAGAILVNSFLPDGEWSVNGTFTYGNYNTIELEGAVGFPIVEDVLSGRVAFTMNRADGNTRNGCSGWDPEANGFDLVNEEVIRQEWDDAGQPTTNKRGRPLEFFGIKDVAQLDVDGICILESPGSIRTADGSWVPDSTADTVEDLAGLNKWTNNTDNWATRGLLRFQPTGTQDWLLNIHGGQNLSDSRHLQSIGAAPSVDQNRPWELVANATESGWLERKVAEAGFEPVVEAPGIRESKTDDVPGSQGFTGGDRFTGWYNRDGLESINLAGSSLTGHMEFGDILVTSITGGEWNDRLTEDEGDACPCVMFEADWSDTSWQLSQEIRAERHGDSWWWVAGFYGLYEDLQAVNFFPNSLDFVWTQSFDQSLLALAPFAHGRYDLTEVLLGWGVPFGLAQWSLEGGLRYNYESKDFRLSSIVESPGGGSAGSIPDEEESGTWDGITGDITLSLIPIENMNTYVKYSRGMKSGHFNASLTTQAGRCGEDVIDEDGEQVFCQSLAAVEPEFIDAVEVGVKGRWFDGRLQGSAALFRYWYQDLQVFDIVNEAGKLPTQQLLNADANVLGVELEVQASPFPGVFIQSGVGWLDTEFIDFQVTKRVFASPMAATAGIRTFDYSGNPLIAAPEWSWSGIVEYTLPWFEQYGSVTPAFDWSYRSDTFLDPQALEAISQPAYWLLNARLAYRTPDQRIEIAAWVRNFLDQEYRVDVFDISRQFSTVLEVWGDPRTFGITISYAW